MDQGSSKDTPVAQARSGSDAFCDAEHQIDAFADDPLLERESEATGDRACVERPAAKQSCPVIETEAGHDSELLEEIVPPRQEPLLGRVDQKMLAQMETQLRKEHHIARNAFSAIVDTPVEEQRRAAIEELSGGANQLASDSLPIDYVALDSIWVTMSNGEQLHMRRFSPVVGGTAIGLCADPEEKAEVAEWIATQLPGFRRVGTRVFSRRVFMLHGEAECGRVFYNETGRGLAHYLANQGYDVFVADLGARGRSMLPIDSHQPMTVHQIISEAVPKLLRAIEQCPLGGFEDNEEALDAWRPEHLQSAEIWVAHGFGGVLLAAAWSRLAIWQRRAKQFVFFGSRRRSHAKGRVARMFNRMLAHPLMARIVDWCQMFPARKLRLGNVDESREWFQAYSRWLCSTQWLDNVDGFDYRAALRDNPLPRSLHFAAMGDSFSPREDVREFIAELGPHDARTVILERSSRDDRAYDHLRMLLDESAPEDVFTLANEWLAQGLCADEEGNWDAGTEERRERFVAA